MFEVKRIVGKKKFLFVAALAVCVILASCLQTAYSTGSMDYTPSTAPVDIKSPSFYSDGGNILLIVKLSNGAFSASPAAGDFLLDGVALSGTLTRDSDTQVRIGVTSLSGGSHRLTVKAEALLSQADRVSLEAVTSGWFPVDSGTVNNIFGVAQIWGIGYGNGKFVVAGAGGRIAVYSTDTGTWRGILPGTSVESGFWETDTIRAVAYGNGKFVAAGYNARMALSANGTDWNVRTESAFAGDSILAVVYGNGKFVAAGDGGKIRYSGSGDSGDWFNAQGTPFGSTAILGLAYGQTSGAHRFVAVGNDGKIAWSGDGLTWTAVTPSAVFGSNAVNAVAYGNGKFVAVGDGGKAAYSSDGESWTEANNLDGVFGSTGVLSVCYGGGKFVAVGHNGKMAELSDTDTVWAVISQSCFDKYETDKHDYGDAIRAVAYGGGMFMAGGNRYEHPYDNNLTYWEQATAKIAYGY